MWTLGLLLTLSLLTLGGATSNTDPRVTITDTFPDDKGKYIVRGFISSDVTLTCFVENLGKDSDVKWQRSIIQPDGSVNTRPISTDMDIEDNNKWSIEKPTSFSWRLRIKALQVLDEGNYTCFVQLTWDNIVSANRTVLAYDKPRIVESVMSSDMTVKENDKLDLMCDASGRPSPTIMWRREGNAILPNGGVVNLGKKLTISIAKHGDRGTYMCRAVNEVGEIIRRIFIQVQFAPKLDGIEQVFQAVGYQRTIVCYVDANPQPVKEEGQLGLYWIKGNKPVIPDDRIIYRILEGAYSRLIFELTFLRVTEDDYGVYVCNAKNNLGSGSHEFKLSKVDEPLPDKGGIISAATVTHSCLLAQFAATLSAILFTYAWHYTELL